MKINEIYIDKFGKLKDFRIDLSEGYNLIYGENESGKTTIFTFIKMMFYGTASEKDAGKALREQYKPREGGQMSGSIDFEFNNEQFMLERKFGETNDADKIVLINLTTGETEKFEPTINVGFMFFGIDADGFENSIYIGQPNTKQTNIKYDEAYVHSKIANLISTGAEKVSSSEILARLERARSAIFSKSDKFGLIDDKKMQLEELAEELALAKEDELAKLKLQKECDVLLHKKKKSFSEYSRIKLALVNQEKLAQIKNMETESKKHATIAKLRRDLAKKEARLNVSVLNIDDAYIEECKQKHNQLVEAEKKRSSLNSALKRISDEVKTVTSSNDSENAIQFLETAKKLNEKEVQLAAVKAEYTEKKQIYDKINDDIKKVDIECQVAVQKSDAMEDVLNHRLFSAEEALRLARETKIISSSKQNDNSTYTIGIAIILFSIILTIWGFDNFFVYGLAVVGILCGLFMLLRQHRKGREVHFEMVDEVAIARANENLIKVRSEIDREKTLASKCVTDSKSRLRALNDEFQPLSKSVFSLQSSLEELEKVCAFLQKKKVDTEIQLAKENSRFNTLKQDNQNVLNKLKEIGVIINNIEDEFIALISKYKKVDTIKTAVDVFENLSETMTEIKTLREKLKTYNENGGPEDSEVIAQKISEINKEILDSNNGNMPELLKPEQLAVLKKSVDESNDAAHAASEEYLKLRADVKIKFIYSKSVAVIERKIAEVNSEIEELRKYCMCIDETIDVINDAAKDVQVKLPSLSTRAEELFHKLTDDKSKNISVYEALNNKPKRGKANSNAKAKTATISSAVYNQAYLSLRLAIAERISRIDSPLPLFMDDMLTNYDDSRAALGVNMLTECSKNAQVIMLTCHKHFIEIAESKDTQVNVIEI